MNLLRVSYGLEMFILRDIAQLLKRWAVIKHNEMLYNMLLRLFLRFLFINNFSPLYFYLLVDLHKSCGLYDGVMVTSLCKPSGPSLHCWPSPLPHYLLKYHLKAYPFERLHSLQNIPYGWKFSMKPPFHVACALVLVRRLNCRASRTFVGPCDRKRTAPLRITS